MTPGGRRFRRPDPTTLLGLALGVGVVWLGQSLEGGSVRSILQSTAAIIVFGGTFGAIVVGSSFDDLRRTVAGLRRLVFEVEESAEKAIASVVHYANLVRRNGIMSLEDELDTVGDRFLARALGFAIDGTPPSQLRDLMEIDNQSREEQDLVPARVFDAAGGYAPTFGILGAVLGLIHVMENLSDPDKLGAGIAVAFVATVYGVASANLVFLPLAAKLKARARGAARRREITLEGVLALQAGLNPWLVEQKLRGFLGQERIDQRIKLAREHVA